MNKEYWFLLHWLKDSGPIHDDELELRDRHQFEWFRHEGWACFDQGWWKITDIGHDILATASVF